MELATECKQEGEQHAMVSVARMPPSVECAEWRGPSQEIQAMQSWQEAAIGQMKLLFDKVELLKAGPYYFVLIRMHLQSPYSSS